MCRFILFYLVFFRLFFIFDIMGTLKSEEPSLILALLSKTYAILLRIRCIQTQTKKVKNFAFIIDSVQKKLYSTLQNICNHQYLHIAIDFFFIQIFQIERYVADKG